MASSKEDLLLKAFLTAAGESGAAAATPGSETGTLPEALEGAVKQIAALTQASEAQTEVLGTYARVVGASPVYKSGTSGGDGEGALGKVASAVFSNAMGMVPLAKAIFGLFGGGDEESPEPLVKYALPPRLEFNAANGPDGMLGAVDYGQNGLARLPEAGDGWSGNAGLPAPAGTSGNQITVQVQAMDSRSFLDHKEDIARAVREAMLNMHALNDVVSEV